MAKFLFLDPKLSLKLSGVPSCPRIEELTASLTELILAQELIPDATRFGEFSSLNCSVSPCFGI